ncbi:MAG: NUDIX hydrolase, partial [Candidatus Limnocylindrales bacterium]
MDSPPSIVPVPAATVVLLRRGRVGFEVLLTRRQPSMAFAPDMHVFPGGRLDDGDASVGLLRRSVLPAAEAALALGGDLPATAALATYVAAIRELFEEAGILLADGGREGAAIPPRVLAQARSTLVGGDAGFA